MDAQKITNVGFLSEFLLRHKKLHDRPFCWVLGSGASIQSGIPAGGTLVHQWLTEMHEREDFDNQPLEQWATEKNLGIKGFDFKNAAAFYPLVYQRRYKDYEDEGYAVLEDMMDKAEPSYGYSVLAQIMAGTEHKVAITTNFDNLLANALAVYTNALPLVCGHELLTGYIRAKLRRPLIAKIHRDVLLNPLNNKEEVSDLADGWSTVLTTIFENYTPIVIGYGGNDGSLMGFLEKLSPIKGGIFWCYCTEEEREPRVQAIVHRHHGKLVPILGFDELMLQLGTKLQVPDPRPRLQATHNNRVAAWQKQFLELEWKVKKPAASPAAEAELKPVREAAAVAVEQLATDKCWWDCQLRARSERDPEKKEAIYRKGLAEFPETAPLMVDYALFLWNSPLRHSEVEHLLREAHRLMPDSAMPITYLASFLSSTRGKHDEAVRLFQLTLSRFPKNQEIVDFITSFRASLPE